MDLDAGDDILLVAGFAVGVLSLQRTDQQKRFEMEAIAESWARKLGEERAEVERLLQGGSGADRVRRHRRSRARTPLAAILVC